MNTIRERMRAAGVVNGHRAIAVAQAAGVTQGVYITYVPEITGVAAVPARWSVVRPGHTIDPDAWYYDHGSKAFPVYGRDQRAPQLAAAQRWVRELCGFEVDTKIPGLPGYYFPREVAEAVRAHLKAKESD